MCKPTWYQVGGKESKDPCQGKCKYECRDKCKDPCQGMNAKKNVDM